MSTVTAPAHITGNCDGFQLEVLAQVVAQLGLPLPATDQALVDEAVRLHTLGLTL